LIAAHTNNHRLSFLQFIYIIFQIPSSTSTPSIDTAESHDTNLKLSKSKNHHSTPSSLLIDLFHSQTKQIVSTVLALTRQSETDYDSGISSSYNRSSSPINDKEQMQLVKNIAIAVRDLLQTLDYAPTSIKEMVKHFLNL
jgi:NADPH-dependent curcumin reductase CurA